MEFHNVIFVLEGSLSSFVIVIEVIPKTLPEEVKAVEVVKPFDIGGISTTVPLVHFYLVWC
jgi:hypothetical protein